MANTLLQLLCFVVMIPMIASVPLLYSQSMTQERAPHTLRVQMTALAAAVATWLVIAYPLIYLGPDRVLAWWLALAGQAGQHSGMLLNAGVQMEFYLYAVVMFCGTLTDRVRCRGLLLFIPLWTLLVYCPVAYLLWNGHGWWAAQGALDFSGGLVVHLTAGVTSLIMAPRLAGRVNGLRAERGLAVPTICTFLILLGWFGFNLAPAGGQTALYGSIVLGTCLAVLGSVAGAALAWWPGLSVGQTLDAIVLGLVTSTAGIGYVPPAVMLLITLAAGFLLNRWLTGWRTKLAEDPVDSFVMNGGGGMIGALGLIIWRGQGVFALVELGALVSVFAITAVGSWLALQVSRKVMM